jgi:glycosyltransferase involved in cell wall biosynthesis
VTRDYPLKVCLIGDYPPPYGGFSVEIEGISGNLRRLNQDCRVLNIGENRRVPSSEYVSVHGYPDFLYNFFQAAREGYLLHLVTTGHSKQSWWVSTILALAGKLNHGRSVLALGSGGLLPYLDRTSGWWRRWIRWVLGSCGMVIVKTQDARDLIHSLGVVEERLCLAAAYSGNLTPRPELLPPEVHAFYEAHRPVVVSSVSFLPEYGIESMLDAIQSLRPDYPEIGLVLAGGENGKEGSVEEIRKRGLESSVLLAGPRPPPRLSGAGKNGSGFFFGPPLSTETLHRSGSDRPESPGGGQPNRFQALWRRTL